MAPTALDALVADLAVNQHGLITRTQLVDLGVSQSAIGRRVEAGRLHRVHYGVYAVGHRCLSRRGLWLAAVLTCGHGATLAGHSATGLWGLAGFIQPIEIFTPASRRPRPGIAVRNRPDLAQADRTTHHGIPCTTPARTVIDCAAHATKRQTERLLDTALARNLLDLTDLTDALDRHPTHRGARHLRRVLATHHPGTTHTANDFEEALLAICDGCNLPRPQTNQPMVLADATPIRPDAIWHNERVVVELDGRAAHTTPASFERDRHRDAQLQLMGYAVLRFTWHQVIQEGAAVAATIAGALAQRTAESGAG